MMRGGLGSRIGQEGERYKLSSIDRSAVKEIGRRLLPHRAQFGQAIAATLLVAAVTAASPLLLRAAIDTTIPNRDMPGLALLVGAYLLMAGLAWWGSYWQRYLSESIGQQLVAGMRSDLLRRLLSQGIDFYSFRPVGELVSRLTGDINSVADVASSGTLSVIGDLVGLLLTTGAMFWLDWRLALVALAMVPVVMVSTGLFATKLRAAYAQVRVQAASVGANLQESLAGMRVVQSLGQESASIERFEQVNLYSLRANMRAMLVFALFFPLMTITGNLGTAAVLVYGGHLIGHSALSLGTVIAFMAYIRNFFMPLRELSQVYNSLQSAAASLDRFTELMVIEPSLAAPEQPVYPAQSAGELVLHDVQFGYGRGDLVLDGLSLRVEAGRRLAVVGPSGAGKTTLANLLTRSYDVQAGHVHIDGVDVRQWDPAALRRAVAVVPQEPALFPGSVLDNITYGRPDAGRGEVVALAEQLGVHETLAALPRGYDTMVGPGAGGRLSGGQRQVIAILRAVLLDPAVLVLDEATSNVDGRTEALINAGLERALAGRTGIVIAHRLRGISLADEIAVLDQGKIVDRGTHAELVERNPVYRQLYEAQGLGGDQRAGLGHGAGPGPGRNRKGAGGRGPGPR